MIIKKFAVRSYLIHLAHEWKETHVEPFDPDLGLEITDELAKQDFNSLIIDCADGVEYKSHPELKRKHTIPAEQLKKLVKHARERNLDIVPKLNFSRSERTKHNDWMRSPDEGGLWFDNFDNEVYWRKAFELIDELIDICGSVEYFHVGMDEDHDRSYSQYVEAIKTLHAGLKKRNLKTIIWNDSAIDYANGHVFAEKCMTAEKNIPTDIIQTLWKYSSVPPLGIIKRIKKEGFELWGAPGWKDERQTIGFRDALLKGNARGIVMSMWIPCKKSNKSILLNAIKKMGPIYRCER